MIPESENGNPSSHMCLVLRLMPWQKWWLLWKGKWKYTWMVGSELAMMCSRLWPLGLSVCFWGDQSSGVLPIRWEWQSENQDTVFLIFFPHFTVAYHPSWAIFWGATDSWGTATPCLHLCSMLHILRHAHPHLFLFASLSSWHCSNFTDIAILPTAAVNMPRTDTQHMGRMFPHTSFLSLPIPHVGSRVNMALRKFWTL